MLALGCSRCSRIRHEASDYRRRSPDRLRVSPLRRLARPCDSWPRVDDPVSDVRQQAVSSRERSRTDVHREQRAWTTGERIQMITDCEERALWRSVVSMVLVDKCVRFPERDRNHGKARRLEEISRRHRCALPGYRRGRRCQHRSQCITPIGLDLPQCSHVITGTECGSPMAASRSRTCATA